MCFSQTLFIITQSCLLVLLALHDWLDLALFNDGKACRTAISFRVAVARTLLNAVTVGCSLLGTIWYTDRVIPTWFAWYLVGAYTLFLTMYKYNPMMIFGTGTYYKDSSKKGHVPIPDGDKNMHPVMNFLVVASIGLAFLKAAGEF